MRLYAAYLLSAVLVFGGVLATILLNGDWEAVAAAVTLLAGMTFAALTIALEVFGERSRRQPGGRGA
jgi:hypothetical protein